MISVKGMTWGTPEFTKIAKRAEKEGDANHRLEEAVYTMVEIADAGKYSQNLFMRLREEVRDAFELWEGED